MLMTADRDTQVSSLSSKRITPLAI